MRSGQPAWHREPYRSVINLLRGIYKNSIIRARDRGKYGRGRFYDGAYCPAARRPIDFEVRTDRRRRVTARRTRVDVIIAEAAAADEICSTMELIGFIAAHNA